MFWGRWFLSEVCDDLIILVLTYLPMLNPRDETNESGNSDSTMWYLNAFQILILLRSLHIYVCIRIEESKEKNETNHFPLVEKITSPSLSDIIHSLWRREEKNNNNYIILFLPLALDVQFQIFCGLSYPILLSPPPLSKIPYRLHICALNRYSIFCLSSMSFIFFFLFESCFFHCLVNRYWCEDSLGLCFECLYAYSKSVGLGPDWGSLTAGSCARRCRRRVRSWILLVIVRDGR